jgi:glyoxylase-like metal-dependent hydrolase (beta-lactamase superfamily II)
MNIVNLGYDSTNYYLLEPDTGEPSGQASSGLLIDVGWPGSLPKLLSICKRKGVAFQKIKYLLITHYHPDHAGLAQEMKNQGVQLIVIDKQLPYIPTLGRFMKPANHYLEISLDGNTLLKASESRNYLKSIGISGKIIETPGHSEDSVSLILDGGSAFTGDLRPQMAVTEEARSQTENSWAKIRSFDVRTIYPGHGPVQQIGD